MVTSNSIQWLLGVAIVLTAAYMLFAWADDVPSLPSEPTAELPISPDNIPLPPADLPIKPVDAKTKACMADMACMQEFFLKVTLGNEYQPSNSADPRISKWQTPINYQVYGWDRLDAQKSDALRKGLADMTKITSLVGLSLSPSTRGINVLVLLTKELEADLEGRFSELADRALRPIPGFVDRMIGLKKMSTICAATLGAKPDKSLGYVGMYLSPAIDDWVLKRCVYEEFSQMLGLYADVADDIDSLYTDQEHRRQLTEFDFLLLRLLYHPLIAPGMDRDEVIAAFPDVYQQTIETLVHR